MNNDRELTDEEKELVTAIDIVLRLLQSKPMDFNDYQAVLYLVEIRRKLTGINLPA